MTAFDNIKTNNWPSTSNEFEDFLVFKAALNDNASLTESPSIVAGSKVLFPKRTLTNSGVSMVAGADGASNTINIAASEYSTSGSVANPGNFFDGDTSTTISSSDGSRIYWTPASNISVTKFEVYFSSQYSGYKIGVEVTGGSSQIITKSNPGNSPGWVEFTSIAGDTIGPSNQIMFRSYRSNDTDPGVLGINAVRVNDKIVTTAAPVTPKKHYDNNADFSSGRLDLENSLFTEDSSLTFGSGDFTMEAWVNISDATASNPVFCGQADGTTTPGSAYIFTLDTTNGRTPRIHVGSAVQAVTWASAFSANTWYHVAMVRDGNTLRLYRDGVQSNSAACSGAANTGSTTHKPNVGSMVFAGTRYTFQGKIQDLRVYKGLCKYPGGTTFTPPSAILG